MKHGPPLALVGAIIAATGLLFVFGSEKDPAPASNNRQAEEPNPALVDPAKTISTPEITAPTNPPKFVSLEQLKSSPHILDPPPLTLNFGSAPFKRQPDGTIRKTDVILALSDLNKPDQDPEEDLQILRGVIKSYHQIFSQNPVAGENWEVVEALTGKNPHKLVFIDPAHPALNARRELIDRWGTPYRFHPISGSHMEFSSAGADGTFGTKDDVLLDEPAGLSGENGT